MPNVETNNFNLSVAKKNQELRGECAEKDP
jgi:hypothetical protein